MRGGTSPRRAPVTPSEHGTTMTQPIRVLFLAADPNDGESRLRLDHELREIQEVADQRRGCPIDVRPRLAPRASDVQRLLMLDAPRVVHFAGHGTRGRGLTMDQGDLLAADLVSVFAHHRDAVRLVVLNACDTLPLAESLSPLIDYVIGTCAVVPDVAATTFSRAFYGALSFGKSVPDAFAMAVTEVSIDRFAEARCYRLLTRPGVVAAPLHGAGDAAGGPAAGAASGTPGAKDHVIRMGDVRSSGNAKFDNSAAGTGRSQDVTMGNLDVGDLNFIN
jgi:hypothetical protein